MNPLKHLGLLLMLGLLSYTVSLGQYREIEEEDNDFFYQAVTPKVEVGFGISQYTNESISSLFGAAGNFHLGVGASYWMDRITTLARVGVKFAEHPYPGNAVEQNQMISVGVDAGYNWYFYNYDWNIRPFFGASYAWFNNALAPAPGFAGDIFPLLRGRGLMPRAGLQIGFRQYFIAGYYELFNPTLNISDALDDNFNGQTLLYSPVSIDQRRILLHTLSVQVGLSFN
ncbi:hypothetical protein [Pontibacter sp. G13]|uniref:hypothetical protein n=1 Tax=Pontibacter sp. G13 TaxID=3074898 RepID=UPI00288B5E79|nr:hypothetical protein [Pontibacter sp. G13]WNJ18206.1 hypothetical protein RJD25_25425 [Pontibacter sp. G13]